MYIIMAEKIYVRGSAKAVKTQYGSLMNFSVNVNDLKEHANEDGRVNLTMGKRQEVWQYWDTHSVWVNDYKKEEEKKSEDDIPEF